MQRILTASMYFDVSHWFNYLREISYTDISGAWFDAPVTQPAHVIRWTCWTLWRINQMRIMDQSAVRGRLLARSLSNWLASWLVDIGNWFEPIALWSCPFELHKKINCDIGMFILNCKHLFNGHSIPKHNNDAFENPFTARNNASVVHVLCLSVCYLLRFSLLSIKSQSQNRNTMRSRLIHVKNNWSTHFMLCAFIVFRSHEMNARKKHTWTE